MEQTPKEMLNVYVDSQKFRDTTEIMDAMKEMFRDVLQQVMESELDHHITRPTSNFIEGLKRQFRQITTNKPSFTNDDFRRKMLYLASRKILDRQTA